MSSGASRPADTEYAPFYAGYVNAVPEGDIVALLREHGAALDAALAAVPEERGSHRYAEGKWSIREVVGHLIDAERIFSYRALRIARGDTTPLAPFDENAYTAAAGSDARPLRDLRDELRAVRASTTWLFASLSAEAWTRVGIASGKAISVRALAYIVTGHAIHHQRILAERYGG
jgi:uncharacterized damage-inducible protein DinB